MATGSDAEQVWWIAGVDGGEARHRVVLVDEHGERVRSRWVANRVDTIEEAIAELVLGLPAGVGLRVVTEATRSLGGVLAQVATSLGVELWQVNPKALARYREVEGQPRKDDDRDAWLAARMCMGGVAGCRKVLDPQPEERALSRLSRLHAQLQGKRSAALSQLRARVLDLAPEVLGEDWEGPAFPGKGMLAVLARWPALLGLESSRVTTIERLLRTSTRYGERCRPMAEALKAAAARVRLSGAERAVVAIEMRALIEELRTLDVSLAEVDTEIRQRVDRHPVGRKLVAMPAVGYLTAAADVGEILPLARNVVEGKAATYAGLTPLSRSSGKVEGRPRLARGVNKHALRANYLSALAAVRDSALDAAYYHKQYERHQGHPKRHVVAILALARQRFKVKYKLMTTGAVYDKEILIASHLDRERQTPNNGSRAA
jgi:transposase